MSNAPPPGPLVLYVDDDHANRVVFEQSLRSDFAIRTVASADEALRALQELEIAVVITDQRMPNMNGDELLRIVRDQYPRTMRIIVTAFTDIDPILRAINEGLVSRYLIKPWQREEMVLCLRWGVENWKFGKDAEELQRRLVETERLATLGLLAGMFAHDVKTPLVSAMLNHDIAMSSVVPRLEATIADAGIHPQTRSRLEELLGDLRATHDIVNLGLDTAKMFLEAMRDFTKPVQDIKAPTEADPLAIVRHSVTVCQSIAQANHAQIDMRLPSVMPHVRMNPVSLTQVLCNLLSNATQAVAERGLKNGMVSIAARVRPEEIELRVSDQGVGMAPDVLKRVGTPFFTTKTEGQGLGLAQCQRLVGTAGGRLQIESEPGVGTTVTVILPTAA